MPTDEGIDVVKQKYDANLAKKKADEAARLARIIAAQKAKELAEQRAAQQREAQIKAQEVARQASRNTTTIMTPDILGDLKSGAIDNKTFTQLNPGNLQPIVGQTVKVPLASTNLPKPSVFSNETSFVKGAVLPKISSNTIVNKNKQTNVFPYTNPLANNETPFTTGVQLPKPTVKPEQKNADMNIMSQLENMKAGIIYQHADSKPQVVQDPVEVENITRSWAMGESDENGNPVQLPGAIQAEALRQIAFSNGVDYLSFIKTYLDLGYVYDRTQDRFIMAKPQDNLIPNPDIEQETPYLPDSYLGGGSYDPWTYTGGGGGSGGGYERDMPGGFGLINWRVSTG